MASRWLRLLVCAVSGFVGPVAARAAGAACDRACLRTTLDQYLNAIVKHDPSAAPLVVGLRQTENAVVVRIGTGAWKSITALGQLQRRFLDPVNGQAGYFGIVQEGAERSVVTLRVKVEDRKIAEAEWIIARKDEWGPNGPGGNAFNPDSLIANPPPERVVPKDARASRDVMTAIANSYFDGLTTHDGSIILHEPGCSRIENGTMRIRTIYAAMFYPPPEAPVPNWPPFEGNWPLPPAFVTPAAPAPGPAATPGVPPANR